MGQNNFNNKKKPFILFFFLNILYDEMEITHKALFKLFIEVKFP